jgi:hypothetical protein
MRMLRTVDHRGLLMAFCEVIEEAVPREIHDIGKNNGEVASAARSMCMC